MKPLDTGSRFSPVLYRDMENQLCYLYGHIVYADSIPKPYEGVVNKLQYNDKSDDVGKTLNNKGNALVNTKDNWVHQRCRMSENA